MRRVNDLFKSTGTGSLIGNISFEISIKSGFFSLIDKISIIISSEAVEYNNKLSLFKIFKFNSGIAIEPVSQKTISSSAIVELFSSLVNKLLNSIESSKSH